MMVRWSYPNKETFQKIYEIKDSIEEEPLEIYKERYKQLIESTHPELLKSLQRYIDEILCELDNDCTLMLFGAGNSIHANTYYKQCNNIKNITAVDFITESQVGLNKNIKFLNIDILKDDFNKIVGIYDYVFTTHTLEHFTREKLLNIVIPKLRKAARKAVIILVPYGKNWAGESSHCCRFYENDELAEMSEKYKRIRNNVVEVGIEIVYWLTHKNI